MFLTDCMGYIASSIIALCFNLLKITYDAMIEYVIEIIAEVLLFIWSILEKIGFKEMAIKFVGYLGQIQYHSFVKPISHYLEYIAKPSTMVSSAHLQLEGE